MHACCNLPAYQLSSLHPKLADLVWSVWLRDVSPFLHNNSTMPHKRDPPRRWTSLATPGRVFTFHFHPSAFQFLLVFTFTFHHIGDLEGSTSFLVILISRIVLWLQRRNDFNQGKLIGRIDYGELSMSQTLINMMLNRSLLRFSQLVAKLCIGLEIHT